MQNFLLITLCALAFNAHAQEGVEAAASEGGSASPRASAGAAGEATMDVEPLEDLDHHGAAAAGMGGASGGGPTPAVNAAKVAKVLRQVTQGEDLGTDNLAEVADVEEMDPTPVSTDLGEKLNTGPGFSVIATPVADGKRVSRDALHKHTALKQMAKKLQTQQNKKRHFLFDVSASQEAQKNEKDPQDELIEEIAPLPRN